MPYPPGMTMMPAVSPLADSKGSGLYDPRNEHDACGVGMVAHIAGGKSHAIITRALESFTISTIAARSAPIRCSATARAF